MSGGEIVSFSCSSFRRLSHSTRLPLSCRLGSERKFTLALSESSDDSRLYQLRPPTPGSDSPLLEFQLL
jgi:hypothetical protein